MDSVYDMLERVPQSLRWGFAGVGALYLGSKVFSFVQLLLSAFVLTGTNLRKYGKPGTWVVITGASDGLGKEYALQLADKGFNLVLVSRTQSKIDALVAEIEQKYPGKGLQFKTLAMDFARNNDADYEKLRELIRGLDIGILINNVGQSHYMPVPFLDTAQEELENIVTINCIGTLRITQVVAPILKARKNGLILTMGSTGGWSSNPLLATYSGSKAFLQQWSNSLASELAADNIDVYLVLAHLVTTGMSKIRRPTLLVPPVRPFVKASLSKIGLGSFQIAPSTYTPWWSHAFLVWVVETFAGSSSPLVIWFNKKNHQSIRQRALRKQAREAKKQ